MRRAIVLGFCGLAALLSEAQGGQVQDRSMLRHNPFSPPDTVTTQASLAASAEHTQRPWRLRGIMLAGRASVVDIDGKILALGEKIDGYRITVINPRQVILTRNGQKRVVSIDNESEEKPNE